MFETEFLNTQAQILKQGANEDGEEVPDTEVISDSEEEEEERCEATLHPKP